MMESTTGIELLSQEMIQKYSHEFQIENDDKGLPEKVIQFGTGILLRGLVDYLIDKANKDNCFNGKIVVVKSTGDDVYEFTAQDNLYTVLEKGISKAEPYEQKNVISCISRVLPARQQWAAILQCAADPAIEIVVSNTTEAGLVFEQESLSNEMPKSFPAKLTAWLLQRYQTFNGDKEKGMIILPTELVSNNGEVLKRFVLQHAAYNNLPKRFSDWVSNNNRFCNTLVDRIVPGRSEKDDIIHWNENLTYTDHLHTTVEPYLLWAIEGDELVKQKLSFIRADNRAVVAESIESFKEQKLRILNGSNTTVVSPAYLAGLNTVYDTVTDSLFNAFTGQLINLEIIPTIIAGHPGATDFAKEVMERFGNPFIRYPLLNVALQSSGKMNNRNAVTIIRYYQEFNEYPPLMSIGLASFFLFYTPAGKESDSYYGIRSGERYAYRDEHTTFLCSTLEGTDWHNKESGQRSISAVLNNDNIFFPALVLLPGFVEMIAKLCSQLANDGIPDTIKQYLKSSK